MEMDRDKVWYLMQKMVPLKWIPNVSYTSNQSYKFLLVKRKKCYSQRETDKNKKTKASKIMDCKLSDVPEIFPFNFLCSDL